MHDESVIISKKKYNVKQWLITKGIVKTKKWKQKCNTNSKK